MITESASNAVKSHDPPADSDRQSHAMDRHPTALSDPATSSSDALTQDVNDSLGELSGHQKTITHEASSAGVKLFIEAQPNIEKLFTEGKPDVEKLFTEGKPDVEKLFTETELVIDKSSTEEHVSNRNGHINSPSSNEQVVRDVMKVEKSGESPVGHEPVDHPNTV